MSLSGLRGWALQVLAASAIGIAVAPLVHAGSLGERFCDVQKPLQAAQVDKLLRFTAIARQALQDSGAEVAIVARSGLNLQRFDVRYSHAGVSLQRGELGAWSVRQLYYACDEGRPQVFDQGLAGFVSGTDDADRGYLSFILLPAAAGQGLQRAVADKRLALALLAGRYSANAYAYSLQYQNCNQWLVELLAAAWGGLNLEDGGRPLRARAQEWLAQQAYAPQGVNVGSHGLMALAPLLPWIHLDDHPAADVQALRLRTSLPADLERFVRQREAGARRIELCHDGHRVVLRRGWEPLPVGCVAEQGDEEFSLANAAPAATMAAPTGTRH